ncbi:MAG: hypothetical protein AB7O04_16805, partial [Hyphomonadaceae bacterium]
MHRNNLIKAVAMSQLRTKTTRLRSKEQSGELVIAFRPFVAAYVKLIHTDGLHGLDVGETADRLICDGILKEVKRNRAPLLMQDGAGNLKRMEHHSAAADSDKLRWFA